MASELATAERAQRTVMYVDASLRPGGIAGGGFVARTGERILLASYPLGEVGDSNTAEAASLVRAVDILLEAEGRTGDIDAHIDNAAVVTPLGIANEGLRGWIAMAQDACRDRGVALRRYHCKGHRTSASASGFLNETAHILADLGVKGSDLRFERPYDAFWRMRIQECHPALVRQDQGLTRAEAADYLGIDPEFVDKLVRHDHLRPVADAYLLSPLSLIAVRTHIESTGVVIPPRREPLRSVRGRFDDPGAGFGGDPSARHPVEVSVLSGRLADGWAAVLLFEGPKTDEIYAARFPFGATPVWETVLAGVLEILRERHPGCDRLTLRTSASEMVQALTVRTRPSNLPAVRELDGNLVNDAFAFIVSDLPKSWQDKASAPWQGRLSRKMLQGVAAEGIEGAWRLDTGIPESPRLEPLGYRPSFLSTAAEPTGPRV